METLQQLSEAGNVVAYINPTASTHDGAEDRVADSAAFFLNPDYSGTNIYTPASAASIQENADVPTLVESSSGDGGVRATVAAIIGHVENDPKATAANYPLHAKLIKRIAYYAIESGNANNYSRSAHGPWARHPRRLREAREVRMGMHRPMMYETLDENGDILLSGIATNCIGLGGSAVAAARLSEAKPALRHLPAAVRLAREADIAFRAVLTAPQYNAQVSFDRAGETIGKLDLTQITGLENVGSKRYAKEGLTEVNIDQTLWQPVVTHGDQSTAERVLILGETFGRLKLGKHIIHPVEFADLAMSIQLDAEQAIPFHSDGETETHEGLQYQLQPGHTLRMRLARLAVPTIMVA